MFLNHIGSEAMTQTYSGLLKDLLKVAALIIIPVILFFPLFVHHPPDQYFVNNGNNKLTIHLKSRETFIFEGNLYEQKSGYYKLNHSSYQLFNEEINGHNIVVEFLNGFYGSGVGSKILVQCDGVDIPWYSLIKKKIFKDGVYEGG